MNLLEILKEEIKKLNITNKLDIARYIYIRTGEIFEYDALWYFGDKDIREKIKRKKIDIRNVTDNKLVCFNWSVMYQELLKEFNIFSNIKYELKSVYDEKTNTYKKEVKHAYVEVLVDKKIYKADITGTLKDFVSIKFGYDTVNNCQVYRNVLDKQYVFQEYNNLYAENIKEILSIVRNVDNITENEYIYLIYRLLEEKLDFKKGNIGFVTEKVYIDSLLTLFNINKEKYINTNYYDIDKKIFISVYKLNIDNITYYFSFEKNDDKYEFKEISYKKVKLYHEIYKHNQIISLRTNKLIAEKVLKKNKIGI